MFWIAFLISKYVFVFVQEAQWLTNVTVVGEEAEGWLKKLGCNKVDGQAWGGKAFRAHPQANG